MSYKTDYKIAGFFEYVVPPLEGFWRQDNVDGVNYSDKSSFHWISVIRLPDFVTKTDFDWAVQTAAKKKQLDCSSAEFLTIEEGLCVQIMHVGSYDDEAPKRPMRSMRQYPLPPERLSTMWPCLRPQDPGCISCVEQHLPCCSPFPFPPRFLLLRWKRRI